MLPTNNFILNSDKSKLLDKLSIDKYGIPGFKLMDQAGHLSAKEIKERHPSTKTSILIACGGGNNGGDGFVIASYLAEWGYKPQVICTSSEDKLRGDAAQVYSRLKLKGITMQEPKAFVNWQETEVIVDALLGTGFSPPLKPDLESLIDKINESKGTQVYSIDIPSGLDTDSSAIPTPSIRATETFAIGATKICLEVFPAKESAGDVIVLDPGFPKEAYDELDMDTFTNTRDSIDWSPISRRHYSHKGSYGHTLVVGGAEGMLGAPILAVRAALKVGAGLTSLYTPRVHPLHSGYLEPEIMIRELPAGATHFTAEHVDEVARYIEERGITSLAIGMGIGRAEETGEFLSQLLSQVKCKVVLDADALFFYQAYQDKIASDKVVLTPHPGEYNRLFPQLDLAAPDASLSPISEIAAKEDVYIIYKSATTILATPDQRIYVNPYGNPGMATAGMGDTLAGVLAGLLAQDIRIESALRIGIALHALSADLYTKTRDAVSLTASNVIDKIPDVLKELEP